MEKKLTFEKLCAPGTCEVCGKNTKIVVVASSIGPVSNGVCKDCLNKGLEPMGNIAAYLAIGGITSYEELSKDSKTKIFVEAQMQARNATDEQWNDLFETVQRSCDMMEDMYEEDSYNE